MGKGSWYHYLCHVPWRFADQYQDDEVGRQLKKLRLGDNVQEALTTLVILMIMAAPAVLAARRRKARA